MKRLDRKTSKKVCRNLLGGDAWWPVNKKMARELGAEVAVACADLINVEKMLEDGGKLPKDDWFFQSIADVEDHTGLNRHSQNKAYAKLRVRKIIEQVNKGVPRRRWFKIDYEALLSYFEDREDGEDDTEES